MSLEPETGTRETWIPAPELEVAGAAHVPFCAVPTMRFEALAREPDGIPVQSMGLSVQVMIDPARRGYDPATRERLAELFGPPERWAPSTSGLSWARVAVTVPGFSGESSFGIDVPCTYDLEVAAAKYFYAVEDGVVPLSFHFNGNVFYRAQDGRLQMTPISWSTTARYGMAVSAWRAMIAEHYPGGGWVRVGDDTLARLHELRARRGLATVDGLLRDLLESA
ncbi:MAG TPA: DUF6084 family protein [Solirubrobacteraceae bacterium]